jgi:hypothetical protein
MNVLQALLHYGELRNAMRGYAQPPPANNQGLPFQLPNASIAEANVPTCHETTRLPSRRHVR